MIRINKNNTAPAILRNRGVTQTDADKAAYNVSPNDYRSGNKKFEFDGRIYADKSVKNALISAHHGKCCYCESKITHDQPGDVEHFRPKGGFRQTSNNALSRPGYYWLAYAWDNLFFSCEICNRHYKKNMFPLGNPHLRARSHLDDHTKEQPLLIDPGAMNPEDYISFRQECTYAIHGNAVGRTTIEEIGLDRDALDEQRRERRETILALKDVAEMNLPGAVRARRLLNCWVNDDAAYASMARAALA